MVVMDLGEFKNSLRVSAPPPVSAPLRGLWWAAKGVWDRAHKAVQDDVTTDAAWVHAYLHHVKAICRMQAITAEQDAMRQALRMPSGKRSSQS
jgi:hypothetical protein